MNLYKLLKVFTVFVGVKAAQPHRPHPRLWAKKKKNGGKENGGENKKKKRKKRGKMLNTCLLFS